MIGELGAALSSGLLPQPRKLVLWVAGQQQMNPLFEIDGKTLTLGASVGIALYQGVQASPSQLLSQADIAMYQAKRAGKHGFCIFDEGLAALNTHYA